MKKPHMLLIVKYFFLAFDNNDVLVDIISARHKGNSPIVINGDQSAVKLVK
jgi:hypothetical protein